MNGIPTPSTLCGAGLFAGSVMAWYLLQEVPYPADPATTIQAERPRQLRNPQAPFGTHRVSKELFGTINISGPDRATAACGGLPSTPTRMSRLSASLPAAHQLSIEPPCVPLGLAGAVSSADPPVRSPLPMSSAVQIEEGDDGADPSNITLPTSIHISVSDLISLSAKATELETTGDFQAAETLHRQSFDGYTSRLGNDNVDSLVSQANLAGVLQRLKRYKEAEELLLSCIQTYSASNREMCPELLSCLDDLAGLFECQEKGDLAEQIYIECIESRRRVQGESHPHTVATMNNLACFYERGQRFAEAETLYVACVSQSRVNAGHVNAATVTYIYNLAGLYEAKLQFHMAEELYISLLADMQSVLGSSHLDTLLCTSKLASLYLLEHKFDLAEALLVYCLDQQRRVLKNYDERIARNMYLLAEVCMSQYKIDQSIEIYQEALTCLATHYGDAHVDALHSMEVLAMVYESIGDYDAAEKLYMRRIAGLKALHGESSAITTAAESDLSKFYKSKDMNDFEMIG